MSINNIERNKLDYILTDLIPVEITELFSFNNFYKYVLDNQKKIDEIILEVKSLKNKNNSVMFENNWATIPLKFNILKGNDSHREISLIQPLAALNIYLFIECYQKEILILLKEKSIFSIRYHCKNNDLYYKKRVNKLSEYYYTTSKQINRGVIQQTGAYFKIKRFNSISSFTNSSLWQQLNFKYSNFARMDYKSCFDSIYSHAYKWISQKNVVDSKDAKNASLFVTIDRLLQNINAKSSNGVIVGPEFSRMIVELLLQQIDIEIKIKLSKIGLENNLDYNIFRYVDDIFIFANSSNNIDEIINIITSVAQKYLLKPNELKLFKTSTPFTLNHWISRTRELADKLTSLFNNSKDLKDLEGDEKYLVKNGYLSIEKYKNDFNALICDFTDEKRTIVSFALSTLLNNIGKIKNNVKLFKSTSQNQAFQILELALYIYAFCPCFEHTQRIISIVVHFDNELKFLENEHYHIKLQQAFDKYSFIFLRGNLNDLCNLLIFFSEFKLILPTNCEDKVLEKILEIENPLLLANFLLYSRYYNLYYLKVLKQVEDEINTKINHITKGEEFLQKEFWYIIIFNNCPFLSEQTKCQMQQIINRIKFSTPKYPNQILTNLVCDFLSQGNNNLFFSWGTHRFSVAKQIAFRTYQRSLFRDYKNKNSLILYGSLD